MFGKLSWHLLLFGCRHFRFKGEMVAVSLESFWARRSWIISEHLWNSKILCSLWLNLIERRTCSCCFGGGLFFLFFFWFFFFLVFLLFLFFFLLLLLLFWFRFWFYNNRNGLLGHILGRIFDFCCNVGSGLTRLCCCLVRIRARISLGNRLIATSIFGRSGIWFLRFCQSLILRVCGIFLSNGLIRVCRWWAVRFSGTIFLLYRIGCCISARFCFLCLVLDNLLFLFFNFRSNNLHRLISILHVQLEFPLG